MPRLNSINFYQNGPKIRIFFLKKFKFSSVVPPAAGSFAPRPPQPVTDGGLVPTPPNLFNSPQLQIFGYAPDQKHAEQSLREVKNRNHHHLNL